MKHCHTFLIAVFLLFCFTSSVYSSTINLTGTIRDFNDTHPDMESVIAFDPDIVLPTLGADGKPIYAGQTGNPTTHGVAAFDQWYNDT